jgi:hypothetical protein
MPEARQRPRCTTIPYGARTRALSAPLVDDGNLVNLFTPITPEARTTFGLDD